MIRAVLAVVLAGAAPVVAADPPDYFPYAKGDRREYRLALDGKTTDMIAVVTDVSTAGGRRVAKVEMRVGAAVLPEEVASDGKGYYLLAGPTGKYDPPRTVLKYPVKAKASWTEMYTAGGEDTTAKTTVGEPAKVRVPAGAYRAVPVETVITAGGQTTTATTWYAEGIGCVKMAATTRPDGPALALELTKFTPGKRP